jgi:hypothetical protein
MTSAAYMANASYGAPVITDITGPGAQDADTAGGQTVYIAGANFGPLTPTGLVRASYGVIGGNMYEASGCFVQTAHTVIECTTVPGVGKPLFWTVTVDGQNSTVPTTTYARPEIHNISSGTSASSDSWDIEAADTSGGQLVVISGAYFGALGNTDIDAVTYGTEGRTYSAQGCTVVANSPSTESVMFCTTAPGVGRDLRFIVKVGGQESAFTVSTLDSR